MVAFAVHEKWKQMILLLAVSSVCYFRSLFGGFLFDDAEAIVTNRDVMTDEPLLNTFLNDFWGTRISSNASHKSYRPLTILTYRINVALSNGKLDPFSFHLTNIGLYALLCILLFRTFKLFLAEKSTDIPFLATLLFVVHPVHVEVVAGLVGRADILCSIFFIAALLSYERVIKTKSIPYFILAVVFTIIGILSKETAIMCLAMCSIYDCVRYFNSERRGKLVVVAVRIAILGIVGTQLLFARLAIMDFEGPIFTKNDNPAAFMDSKIFKVLTNIYIHYLNLVLLLWPQWLCFDWSMGCIPVIGSLYDYRLILAAVFVIFFSVFTYTLLFNYFRNTNWSPAVCGFLLLILPFVPAMNIFMTVGFVIAERILLLPSAGFCFLVAIGYGKLERWLSCYKKELRFAYFLLCTIFAMRTIQRNEEWLSEEQLFTSALSVCPLNAKVHYNVGKIAADKQNKLRAMDEYRIALDLNPSYEQAMNNLANLLREDREFNQAEKLLRNAVLIRPNFAAAWMNLGIVLTNLNGSEEAEICYLNAITHRPRYPDCYYNLGNLYLDLNRKDEALKAWEQAVKFKPTHTAAWSNSLVLLDSLHRYEEVKSVGNIALKYNPKSAALHFSIGNTLGKLLDFETAEKHFLEALNINPYNALYFSNLGVLYHRWGQLDNARKMYKKALSIDPHLKSAMMNLNKLLNNK